MRRLLFALSLVWAAVVAPATVSAAPGACSVTIEPATVDIGDSFTVTATGFTPNGDGLYLYPGVPGGLAITFDATGSFTRTEVTAKPYYGQLTVNIWDTLDIEDGSCDASETVVVVSDCSAAIEPSTVTVGEEYTLTGTNYRPDGSAFVSWQVDYPYEAEAILSFDSSGALSATFTARKGDVGTRPVGLGDGDCSVSVNLTVLGPPSVPATDTDTVARTHEEEPILTVGGLLLLGLGSAFAATRRRRPTRDRP